MSQNIGSEFLLHPFTDNDYIGLVALKNSLFPDHPTTVEQMEHNDKNHYGKITLLSRIIIIPQVKLL